MNIKKIGDYEYRLCRVIDTLEPDNGIVPAVHVRELFGKNNEYVILGAEVLPETEEDVENLTEEYYIDTAPKEIIFE